MLYPIFWISWCLFDFIKQFFFMDKLNDALITKKSHSQPKQYIGHRQRATKGLYKKQGLEQKIISPPSKLHNTKIAGYKGL